VEEAEAALSTIRAGLRPFGHKVNTHDPFTSLIEGLYARGDERVGEWALEAFEAGSRLEAWSDYFRTLGRPVWESIIAREAPAVAQITGERDKADALPWDAVHSGTSKAWLRGEAEKSAASELTSPCAPLCPHPCGVCGKDTSILVPQQEAAKAQPQSAPAFITKSGETYRMLFAFSKEGPAVYLPHLAVIEALAAAFLRSGFPVAFSEGFNPLPRLDFAAPVSLGIRALAEAATVDLASPVVPEEFVREVNAHIHTGFAVRRAGLFVIPEGVKKRSVSSLLWGYEYSADGNSVNGSESVRFPAREEKAWREAAAGSHEHFDRLVRRETLAQGSSGPASYFEVYSRYYNTY
jgi:radical SAM-linked protein